MKRLIISVVLLLCAGHLHASDAVPDKHMAFIGSQIAQHPKQSGAYVLNTGAEALIARAWLTDHAQQSIEVQYFIWSTDNIGMLASEALLRAADRGVKVRVIVDDLMIDAPDKVLLALAKHPNIDIRIYNPQHSVGTPLPKRVLNVVTDFRGANQRMHDKTFIVDGQVAITGGRNMAAEYFDYNHTYNFRDRDVLLLGAAVAAMQASFENFWRSPLSVSVEDRFQGYGLMQKHVTASDNEVKTIYQNLHDYAGSKDNFAPEVRAAIEAIPTAFPALAQQVVWGNMEFISDLPGKNTNRLSLGGGGRTSLALAQLVQSARDHIVIQSPYLVMSDEAKAIFQQAIARGVRVSINTNSLASTDNLPAFSGYRNQRNALIKMGIEITEFKPHPAIQRKLMEGSVLPKGQLPIFAIHAKTMVIDAKTVFIGTFNFDPRSQNLNTEAGVVIHNDKVASSIEAAIRIDMQPDNSWSASSDDPDQYASAAKRSKVRFLQMTPIKPLL